MNYSVYTSYYLLVLHILEIISIFKVINFNERKNKNSFKKYFLFNNKDFFKDGLQTLNEAYYVSDFVQKIID